jgi:tRNA(His) guanylyltransferase
MNKDSLGDRMKSFYEDAYRINLPQRMPLIIRVDGKAFSSYTAKCKKPIDDGLIECMNDAALSLCKQIQGAKLAYVQSDEISLLVTNYEDINTQSLFNNNLQKITSVSASIASVTFTQNSYKIWGYKQDSTPFIKPAYFDSRVFVLPKEEVNNYFHWRQADATRNSIQMLARSLYSHKQLNKKNSSELQELCFQKGFNWHNLPTTQKRGRCIIKSKYLKEAINPISREFFMIARSQWIVDNEIPIFSKDKNYINQYI